MRATCTLLLIASLLGACAPKKETAATTSPMIAPVLTGEDARDIHSFAVPAEARVTHVDLDLTADFGNQVLAGVATLDVIAANPDATLTLDTRGLAIETVTDTAGRELDWELGGEAAGANAILGAPLRVALAGAKQVRITYRTGAEAEAVQWLTPAQTAGRTHPYLFTQGQAILTRTWIPTQDSPGIRQSWSARIVAPSALTAVMSAGSLGSEEVDGGARAWRFRMEHPVAPYLIALAIGDLEFRELAPRMGVYTEPAGIAASADEFADLQAMMKAAESLYGEYRWGRYDVLVLPPSFPFGGMENPRLTFATPTIIAGDRSLVSLIAHELAHSWSGNLVTNATWADFWLNEGFTVYIEHRIMEVVYGERFAAMLADLGWDSLQQELARLPPEDTRLHLDLTGRDPDAGLTDIAYEKGATFLRTIEEQVGRARFDTWLRGYFDRHAFRPQTSAGFLADIREHLIKGDAALEGRIGLEEWVHGTGLPANARHIVSQAFVAVDAASAAFAADGTLPETGEWSTHERVRFLNRLPRKLPKARLDALVQLLHLDTQRNSEVRFAWLELAIANRYEPAVPGLEDFLVSQGRRKFVMPLFKALMAEGEWGRPLAIRIYERARPGYHAVTYGSVDEIVPRGKARD